MSIWLWAWEVGRLGRSWDSSLLCSLMKPMTSKERKCRLVDAHLWLEELSARSLALFLGM